MMSPASAIARISKHVLPVANSSRRFRSIPLREAGPRQRMSCSTLWLEIGDPLPLDGFRRASTSATCTPCFAIAGHEAAAFGEKVRWNSRSHSWPFRFDPDEIRLGNLVRRPADGRAWCGSHDPRFHASEETLCAFSSPNYARCGGQTPCMPDLCFRRSATRLQESLNHIQRCCCSRCESTSKTSRNAVR